MSTATSQELVLDESVRCVEVRFRVKDQSLIPVEILDLERPAQVRHGNADISGTLVIKPTELVDVGDFFRLIRHQDYVLTDAFWQQRNSDTRTYWIIGFTFERRDFVLLTEWSAERDELLDDASSALDELCLTALWRVRAIRNQLCADDEPVPDVSSVSLDIDFRRPLYDENGELICQRPSGKKGRNLGETPVPIRPAYRLIINEQTVDLWPA